MIRIPREQWDERYHHLTETKAQNKELQRRNKQGTATLRKYDSRASRCVEAEEPSARGEAAHELERAWLVVGGGGVGGVRDDRAAEAGEHQAPVAQ